MTLRELINRLEELSCNGVNDNLDVFVRQGQCRLDYPEVVSAFICQDPDYNFDEANCGPDEYIELNVEQ